jgi:peptidoglycan/xylan/chitin deacetylase (PgdA/CDA1 family)
MSNPVAGRRRDTGDTDTEAAPRLACLTLDLEPDLRCPEHRLRLFDDDDRFDGFLAMLAEAAVPLTCFTVMSIAPRYADRLALLRERAPVEFAVHSFSHDPAQPATEDELRRAWDTYTELWNTAPLGYRAPNCLIDDGGIARLIDRGFRYDSSITPSIRLDSYGYNRLGYARTPFLFEDGERRLIELPIACLAGLRLPFVLSYIKLLGFGTYRAASTVCPLPESVVTYFHPYDLYAADIADNIPGWKRRAHLRNAAHAPSLLRQTIGLLQARGYRFVTMSELAQRAARSTTLPIRRLDR